VLPEIPTLNYRFALGNLHKGTLKELVASYFACRTVYEEVMPTWTSPLVPWDEIVSERSWAFDCALGAEHAPPGRRVSAAVTVP